MIPAAAFLTIFAVVAIVAIALSLRSLVFDEARNDVRLHDPLTPTVTYAVPNGIDPVRFAVALTHAGFANVVDDLGAVQALRVECDGGDRERVRRVIAGVPVNEFDGSVLQLGHVVFEDER